MSRASSAAGAQPETAAKRVMIAINSFMLFLLMQPDRDRSATARVQGLMEEPAHVLDVPCTPRELMGVLSGDLNRPGDPHGLQLLGRGVVPKGDQGGPLHHLFYPAAVGRLFYRADAVGVEHHWFAQSSWRCLSGTGRTWATSIPSWHGCVTICAGSTPWRCSFF